MVGIILLLVGAVLLHNGVCILLKSDGKAAATVNLMGGLIIFILYMLYIVETRDYLLGGVGLLFAITYIFIGVNSIWGIDIKPFGWFCLFTTLPIIGMLIITLRDGDGSWQNIFLASMWLQWGIVWFALFVEDALEKSLGKLVPYLCVLTAVTTGLIPGFMMMAGWW